MQIDSRLGDAPVRLGHLLGALLELVLALGGIGRLADRRAGSARIRAPTAARQRRGQHGSARQLLLANAAVSAVAAVALGVAATGNLADVLAVFGVWAATTGAAQLIVALRRRALLGNQWPLLLADGVSVLGGVAFVLAAAAADKPNLSMLAIYAATGGTEFVIQAWLLARRRHRLATASDPVLSAS